MKKLLMFLCCVFAMDGAFARGTCQYVTNLDSVANTNVDERLDIGGNAGYVCDAKIADDKECPYHTTFVTHKGVFVCYDANGSIDPWLNRTSWVKPCTYDMISSWWNDGGIIEYDQYLLQERIFQQKEGDVYMHDADGIYSSICTPDSKTINMLNCLKAIERGEPAHWNENGEGVCSCSSVEGISYTWVERQGKCVLGSRDSGKPKETSDSLQKCLNERKGNKEGMACCYLSKNEAEFTGGKCICKNNREFSIGADGRGQCKAPKEIPDELQKCLNERKGNDVGTACCYLQEKNEAEFTGSKCVCKNGGEFSVGDGHGQCKVKDDDSGMPFDCPEINLSADSSCPDAVRAIADLKVYCADAGRTKDGYEARVNTVNTFIQLCKDQKTAAENDVLKNKAKQLEEQISSKLSGWRETLTVWKTAEGNFNGARLASDSIAGVVLGTAGGLITSSVVKKNQVKSGFEDIQCTVGGQKVADWHDEFTVGIQ